MRIIFLILLFCTQGLFANKYHWLFSAQYTRGFETREINLWLSEVEGLKSNGVLLSTSLQLEVAKGFSFYGGIGTRAYSVYGETEDFSFSGDVLKILFLGGAQFKLNQKHGMSLGLFTENNSEFDDFKILNSDLLRYAWHLGYQYQLTQSIGLTAGITSALYPLNEVYLIENPSNFFSLGINYKLF